MLHVDTMEHVAAHSQKIPACRGNITISKRGVLLARLSAWKANTFPARLTRTQGNVHVYLNLGRA
jgi:hypothetical protein